MENAGKVLQPTLRFGHEAGNASYVPVLKSMGGEYRALATADAPLRKRLLPMIEVRARSEGGHVVGMNPISNLANRLAICIGPGWTFLMDFPWMAGATKERGGESAMQHVFSGCRKRGLLFVPVVGVRRDDRYLTNVADA